MYIADRRKRLPDRQHMKDNDKEQIKDMLSDLQYVCP